jgi:hypothetical protein
MLRSKYLFLAFILISNLAMARGDLFDNKKLKSTILNAKVKLKKIISDDFSKSSGLKQFSMDMKFKINFKKLEQVLGVSKKQWEKFDQYKLPGLFVDGEDGYGLMAVRNATVEDVIQAVSTVDIKLFFYNENFERGILKEHVKNAVLFNVPGIKERRIKLQIKFKQSPNMDDGAPRRFFEFDEEKALKVSMTESKFMAFWNKYYYILGPAAILILLGFVFWVLKSIKSGFASISETIENKNFTVSGGGGNRQKQEVSEQNKKSAGGEGVDTFSQYMKILMQLKELVNTESEIYNELILMVSIMEEFDYFIILMDALKKEDKEKLIRGLSEEKREHFKEYVVNNAVDSYEDTDKLVEKGKKLIQLIKVSSMDPKEFYKIILKDSLKMLSIDEFCSFLKEATKDELSFMLEFSNPVHLSYAIGKGFIAETMLSVREVVDLDKDEMIEMIVKLGASRTSQFATKTETGLKGLYAHLDANLEESLGSRLGVDPSQSFEALFMKYKKAAITYLMDYDFDDMVLIMALFSENMKLATMEEFPDLLKERLQAQKFEVTPYGIELKGLYYNYLKSLDEKASKDGELDSDQAA